MKIVGSTAPMQPDRIPGPPRPTRSFQELLGGGVKDAAPHRAFGFGELGMLGRRQAVMSSPDQAPSVAPSQPAEDETRKAAPADAPRSALPLSTQPPASAINMARTETRTSASASSAAPVHDSVPPAELSSRTATGPARPAESESAQASWSTSANVLGKGTLGPLDGEGLSSPSYDALRGARTLGQQRLNSPKPALTPHAHAPAEPVEAAPVLKAAALLVRQIQAAAKDASVAVSESDGTFTVVVGAAGLSSGDEDKLQRLALSLASQLGLNVGRLVINGAERPTSVIKDQRS